MYTAILLGFLVAPRPEVRLWAAEGLGDPRLARLCAVVRGALRFYSQTGALLEENRDNLTRMAAALEHGW